MTDLAVLSWIKENLAADIKTALSKFTDTIWSEPDLAGLTCRETGVLIKKYAPRRPVMPLAIISSLMRGDYSQREGEASKGFHGYGFTQIDIKSFPDFVKSGDWKIPLKCYIKSLNVLAGKASYISSRFPNMELSSFKHATLAAYNAGEGNVVKALNNKKDADAYTTGHDYAAAVEGFSAAYANL